MATTRSVDTVTRMRHRREQAWDAGLLEVPLRHVCRLPCFAQFVCHVVSDIEALRESYNAGLAKYRLLNRLKSQSHPMPDLGETVDGRGGRIQETPAVGLAGR